MTAKSRTGNGKIRMMRNFPFLAGLGVAVLFFCIGGYSIYSKIITLKGNVGWVVHTHDVIVAADELLSSLKDAETGQRGYLLTGAEEYLAPYEKASREIPAFLDKIQDLTSDNAVQQNRLRQVRALISEKIKELGNAVNVRRTQGFDPALAIVMSGQGKNTMDDLRDALNVMKNTEVELRQQRFEEMESAYYNAIVTGVLCSLLGIVLSVAVTALLYRAAWSRRREEWLQAGRAGLGMAMLGDQTLDQLGRNILKFLAEYLDAQAGIFFARKEAGYRRIATYGFPSEDGAQETVNKNDDLLGQAIQDARTFVVNDVPDGYIRVGSGLGQGKPRNLVISPASAEGAVNAVFELGFVHGIDGQALRLLEDAADSIGIAVQSANYRSNLQRLLEETQTQAEELQSQSEELRVSNEELEEQSRSLKESQVRLEQQQEELEVSNEELEEKTKALEEHNARIQLQAKALDESKKQVEEKARELELSSKYKSEFLANMSHELRTPLNSLLILAKNLAGNEEGNLTEEQVEEANIIHNGGLDLLTLINDILDLSKVEAGKMSIVADDAPVHDIVRKIGQQFAPVAGEKDVAFDISVAGDVPETIHTDSQRVEQVLKNLLSNAFKFTERGAVKLSIYRPGPDSVMQRASLSGGAVAFAVTDTGIGIDETKLNSIFEAFQQEDGSTDRHYGGTGLGLTIARKFAHMLGGEIHVASRKGQGSTFTLILPEKWAPEETAKKSGAHNHGETPARAPEISRTELKVMPKAPIKEFIPDDRNASGKADKTLLIIEDDRDFAHILMKMAQKRGYHCLVAGDGKTGLLLASEQPVSAVILDLRLPDIDGMTVLDQFKHNLKTRHIPIHIITGMTGADISEPLRKGAVGYLSKPVKAEDIDGAFRKFEDVLRSSIKKIMVVEDDRKSQVAIQTLLKKKDLDIVCIGTGQTALKRVLEEKFDCIILDLALPDMTGFDWLAHVAEQNSDHMPPVIVYTAKELTEEENRRLNQYTGSIVIKGAHSSERLLDEVTLFLHSVESTLSKDQQAIIRMQHDPGKVLENRTVLLVDDDLRNTFALSKILKKEGLNVVIADNGQMALDKLKQSGNVELVIMDIMMPIMDGYQAMRRIRAEKAWQKLPIIALTARAMPEEQEKCMEAGANDYLTKPVDLERLLTLMRVWLFRQEHVS